MLFPGPVIEGSEGQLSPFFQGDFVVALSARGQRVSQFIVEHVNKLVIFLEDSFLPLFLGVLCV